MSTPEKSQRTEQEGAIKVGDTFALTVDRMAHGGEGIGNAPDGRIVFVQGGFPGGEVEVRVTKAKKSFAHAELVTVLQAGPHRVASSCPAAELGAGCCDFAEVKPGAEVGITLDVLVDPVNGVALATDIPEIATSTVDPQRGWRTRVRLAVDEQGRAGAGMRNSNAVVYEVACSQLVPGLVDGL